jgi:uncharacterized protein (TIGR04255 family)
LTEYEVFPNAPITEALVDIRVSLSDKITLDDLALFQDPIRERFPEKKERRFIKGGLEISAEPKATLSTGPDGYIFECSAEKKLVQARLDGFTFNKLKPYDNWKSFRSEAYQLWNLYFDIAKPIKITRIALRYINRIEVPLPVGRQLDFSEYLLISPEIAADLPQALAHFFMRVVMPNDNIDAIAVITETIQDPTPDKRLPLIFDIDVFQETAYEGNDPDIWDQFDKLHDFKNDIFFKSTTEKAKELFR